MNQQLICKVCGRPDKFDFHVPDKIWASIIPAGYRSKVVCLYCFDEFAGQQDVDYHPHLSKLHFAGRQATFIFKAERGMGRC